MDTLKAAGSVHDKYHPQIQYHEVL